MTRHRPEVADVFRKYGNDFLTEHEGSVSTDQHRVLRAIAVCRTEALGGHIEKCDACGHKRNAYNSCRNRHCPKCQATDRAKWLDARVAELLPIPYFHAVFTLPREIGPIAYQNKRIVYGILMRAAAEALQELAADPKHLGGEISVLAVLHTWGQNLMFHPHVHCVVSGGGISPDGSQWVPCKRIKRSGEPFLIPVKVLRRKFRGKFIAFLKRAYRRGELAFFGSLAPLGEPLEFERRLNAAVRHDWIVDVRPPFGNPKNVLKYLARYTHRVAIANSRLIDMEKGRVRFRWKDYADHGRQKVMSLSSVEFIRRFLLHVFPSGFMHIRHYGFLANRFRKEKLALCQRLLGIATTPDVDEPAQNILDGADVGDATDEIHRCPCCKQGRMVVIQELLPAQTTKTHSRAPP